ncbi:MAG: hypothetical protein KatS3mg050_2766 [Litorilinea sp.]|nr:MAG: hypothetical protein KatS3mg050_2766 [Litorilinea sp.]
MNPLGIRAERSIHIPDWALRQRHLIAVMNEAAPLYQERYTRQDGTFVWRESWPGMDGSDDGYESYHNWPLFYALGGDEELHRRSRFLWEAVTRQFTQYGQIYREFDAYYDWMHHGESSIYFYYFGLADPNWEPDRARALRFAGFYMGDDPTVPNWDPEKRMIRSPINGSKGPRFENSWDDWSTHRWVLAEYPVPFDDLDVPTELKPWRGEMVPMADWNDDAVYAVILEALNRRQMRCDVPLNLTATSLITHAFLYTGEDRYRAWVLDYLEAWADRIRQNGGICPDNVGPNGIIGETMDGKWWGGYYGWRWPHGFMTIIEPLTIAAMNAVLLTGDMSYLDIPRGQLDRLLELGREEGGQLLVPYRHTDAGWTSYRPMQPHHAAQIWYMSQDPRDRSGWTASPKPGPPGWRCGPAGARGMTSTSAPGTATWMGATRTTPGAFWRSSTQRCCGAWTRSATTTATRRRGTCTTGRMSTRCTPRPWCSSPVAAPRLSTTAACSTCACATLMPRPDAPACRQTSLPWSPTWTPTALPSPW